jgi:hypothetical protein
MLSRLRPDHEATSWEKALLRAALRPDKLSAAASCKVDSLFAPRSALSS